VWKDSGRFYDRRFQAWKGDDFFSLGAGRPLGHGKGGGFFSPRRLMVSRARDIWIRAARRGTLLRMPLPVPAGCFSAGFFPAASIR
ncbi:hypothetical protein B296_00053609, partial [Ensete ventricosum]